MIEVKHLSREYKVFEKESGIQFRRKRKTITALNDISFEVCEGRNIGVLGMNGAGKSTLIKLMCGIIAPTSGNVLVESKYVPFEKKKDYLRKISLVSGNKTQLNYDLSARDNFHFLGAIYGLSRETVNVRAEYLAARIEAGYLIDRQVRKMSFGERLKMEIVAALLHDPKYIFLDEPTIGLDVKTQDLLRKFIKDYNDGNRIVFITSHNLEDISQVCDDLLFINHGSVEYYGDLDSFCRIYSTTCKIVLKVSLDRKENIICYLLTSGIGDIEVLEDKIYFEIMREKQVEFVKKLMMNFPDDIINLDMRSSDVDEILKKKILEEA